MKQITYDQEAMNRIKAGVDKLANAVKTTLGPGGSNVIIEENNRTAHITKDGVTVAKSVYLEDPIENLGAQIVKEAASRTATMAGDGPQPLWSKVLTPRGFVEMGDLNIGDEICGTNGTTQKVVDIFKKGKREIYKVTFSDDQVVECCSDHLWRVTVTTKYGKPATLPLKSMIQDFRKKNQDGSYTHKYYVEKTIPQLSRQEVEIDPYLLGVLIGDGSMTDENVEISLGLLKEHIIQKLILPEGITKSVRYDEKKNYFRVKLNGKTTSGKTMKELVTELGLNVGSRNKFIPKKYLFNDIEGRNLLLAGLRDTDGHVNKKGLIEYTTVSHQLAKDFHWLMLSLGRSTKISLHDRSNDPDSYSDTPIYRMYERKGFKYGIKVVNIEATGDFTEMQCLKVSNEDHLYITDDFVVTHNTTTATVLAQAILNQGIKNVVAGANRIDIKRGIDMATKAIVAEIKKMSVPVGDNVRNIALISANGDNEVADLITEAIEKVTKDGLVIVEDSRNATSEVSVIEGMTFDRGWLNHHFINNQESGTVEFSNPLILLVDYIIEDFAPMIPILRKIQIQHPESPILIIAEDVRGNALSTLALNVVKQGMRICAVQSPDFGDTRKEVLKDLAALTNATIITKDAGMTLSNIDVDVCGTCEKIRVSQWETTIFGGAGRGGLLEARLELMKTQMEQANENALAKLKDRFARLTGLIGVIHIGGFSEIEVREKKDRIDDALQATRAAIEEGIVPGGGVAYVRALQAVREGARPEGFYPQNEDQLQGTEILFRAIMEPIKCVAENVGVNGEVVLNEVNKINNGINKFTVNYTMTVPDLPIPVSYGFNAKTQQYEDLLAAGVIDPAKVTRLALENAASVSGMLLTTKSIITYLPQK